MKRILTADDRLYSVCVILFFALAIFFRYGLQANLKYIQSSPFGILIVLGGLFFVMVFLSVLVYIFLIRTPEKKIGSVHPYAMNRIEITEKEKDQLSSGSVYLKKIYITYIIWFILGLVSYILFRIVNGNLPLIAILLAAAFDVVLHLVIAVYIGFLWWIGKKHLFPIIIVVLGTFSGPIFTLILPAYVLSDLKNILKYARVSSISGEKV